MSDLQVSGVFLILTEIPESLQQSYTEREVQEIRYCMVYAKGFAHGTNGHTERLLIAKLAQDLIRERWKNAHPEKE
jgi:hypothetical protein